MKMLSKIIVIMIVLIFMFLVFESIDYYNSTGKVEEVPCYDKHNNEMQGLTCLDDQSKCYFFRVAFGILFLVYIMIFYYYCF